MCVYGDNERTAQAQSKALTCTFFNFIFYWQAFSLSFAPKKELFLIVVTESAVIFLSLLPHLSVIWFDIGLTIL